MDKSKEQVSGVSKSWKHYLALLGGGFMVTDAMPHFISAVLGQGFPTLVSSPPTVGLSGPVTNVVFSFIFLFIGYVLLRVGKVKFNDNKDMLAVFVGIVICGLVVSSTIAGNPNL